MTPSYRLTLEKIETFPSGGTAAGPVMATIDFEPERPIGFHPIGDVLYPIAHSFRSDGMLKPIRISARDGNELVEIDL